jgi:hypothetical protein
MNSFKYLAGQNNKQKKDTDEGIWIKMQRKQTYGTNQR